MNTCFWWLLIHLLEQIALLELLIRSHQEIAKNGRANRTEVKHPVGLCLAPEEPAVCRKEMIVMETAP